MAGTLNNLAVLYDIQGKPGEAERLYRRALSIDEKALGKEHPSVAIDLNNLAILYNGQRKYNEAEPLYKQALSIWEKTLGPDHPHVASGLENYAALLRMTNRAHEAAELLERAKAIRAKYASQGPTLTNRPMSLEHEWPARGARRFLGSLTVLCGFVGPVWFSPLERLHLWLKRTSRCRVV